MAPDHSEGQSSSADHVFYSHCHSSSLAWEMPLANVLALPSASADVIVPENGEPVGTREIKCCMRQIQELIISRLNQAVANKLISSVDYLRESFVGTLERCLQSLEKSQDISVHITSNNLKQVLRECLRHHVTDNT